MARFYARFDGANETDLDNDYFDKLIISDGSTTAAALRAGLIASRSALSDAMFAQLDKQNEYGDNGPIIPREIGNISQTGPGGTLSWNNVYTTSTIPGVVIPSNFRTRPTGSPTTTDGNLTARSPADSGTINNDVYLSASNALSAVLNNISNGKSPLTPINQGNFPTRSLHSLWHDYDVRYFAWDDFTPGQPVVAATGSGITTTGLRTSAGHIDIGIYSASKNDFNPNTTCSIDVSLWYATSSNQIYPSDRGTVSQRRAKFANITIPVSALTGSGEYRYYRWVTGTIITGSFDSDVTNVSPYEYSSGVILSASITFIDPVANLNSQGPTGISIKNSGTTFNIIKSDTTFQQTNGAWLKIGSA